MKSQEGFRRKRLLIDPHFQSVFALYTVFITLVLVPIFIAANFYFFTLFTSKAHSVGLPEDHELLRFAERQQSLMIVVFAGITLLAVVLNIVVSFVFSNRIAGSMYRLRTELNQAKDWAQAKKITPRNFDFFQDVTEAYNHLLDRSGS